MAEYKTINEITNISTQANDDDLLIMWDKNREKTVKIKDKDFNKNNQPKTLETPIEVDNIEETTVEGALGAINDKVKNFTAGVAFKGTRSAYNTAKLIPEGSDGHIPSGALVIITDEGKTYVTNGTGSGQTLELVANATFNGSHAEWNALTPAQKAMYNIVNFDDDEAIGLQISDVVEDGNMNPVTSNAVANLFLVEEDTSYNLTLEPKNYTEWQTVISHTKLGYRLVSLIAMPLNNDAILTTVHRLGSVFRVTVFNCADVQQTQTVKLTVVWMKD